jgi:4'-phosphopantetheinyl transferase
MPVCWLEQTEGDVPVGDEWLSADERKRLAGLRILKRRRDWRLGRWTAKCALAEYLNRPRESSVFAEVELRPSPSGVPEVFLRGRPGPVAVSLSHSHGRGLCVLAPAGIVVGCDLEKIEPRSPVFLTDYFTGREQALVAQRSADRRDQLVTLLWSAKESALKAMGCGLREDPRSVHAEPDLWDMCLEEWHPLSVTHACGGRFFGWWRESRNLIRTVLSGSAQKKYPVVS